MVPEYGPEWAAANRNDWRSSTTYSFPEHPETRVRISRISRPQEIARLSGLTKVRICLRGAALALLSLLGAALLVCKPANSESRQRDTLLEAKTLTDQASSLQNAGDYSRAETLSREALTIRESLLDPGDPEVAESLYALARIYDDEARFGEAEELLRRAIKIDEKVLGSRNLQDGHQGSPFSGRPQRRRQVSRGGDTLSSRLGRPRGDSFRQEPQRSARATTIWQRYTTMRANIPRRTSVSQGLGNPREGGRPESWQVGETLDNLATLYDAEGRYTEGIPLEKRAIAIYQKALGPEHPKLAALNVDLAELYEDEGDYRRAAPLLRQALSILQKTFGAAHPNVAETLRDLGVLSEMQGDYSSAEQQYRQALEIREKSFGSEHRYVAESLNDLGSLYEKEGRYQEAEPLLERAVAIRARTLGPNHPELAESQARLAAVLASEGQTEASLWPVRARSTDPHKRSSG